MFGKPPQSPGHLGIPPAKKIILAIVIGYLDQASPVNAYRSQRDEADAFLRWVDGH